MSVDVKHQVNLQHFVTTEKYVKQLRQRVLISLVVIVQRRIVPPMPLVAMLMFANVVQTLSLQLIRKFKTHVLQQAHQECSVVENREQELAHHVVQLH